MVVLWHVGSELWQTQFQHVLGRVFFTKCINFIQNTALLQIEMTKLLHFKLLFQNAQLKHDAAQQCRFKFFCRFAVVEEVPSFLN